MITIGEDTKLFVTIMFGLWLIVEMPVLVFFFGPNASDHRALDVAESRYSILAMFVAAAIITPTGDILNMWLFAAPMIALCVLSIGVAWLVNSKREPVVKAG